MISHLCLSSQPLILITVIPQSPAQWLHSAFAQTLFLRKIIEWMNCDDVNWLSIKESWRLSIKILHHHPSTPSYIKPLLNLWSWTSTQDRGAASLQGKAQVASRGPGTGHVSKRCWRAPWQNTWFQFVNFDLWLRLFTCICTIYSHKWSSVSVWEMLFSTSLDLVISHHDPDYMEWCCGNLKWNKPNVFDYKRINCCSLV